MLKSEMIELYVDHYASIHGKTVDWARKSLATVPAYQLSTWIEKATTTVGTPEHEVAKVAARRAMERRLTVTSGRRR